MTERKMRVLSIGAHPDDADTSAGGLLTKLKRKGWEIRLLSVTDGSAGTYHLELAGQELNLMRRAEAAASGARLGARYDVLDHPDGRLEVTLEIREELIRYIRRFAPDLIITNRLNDYHADHRNTAQLVQDASFLLTVPAICSDVPAMPHMPVVLYWHDSFKKPYPCQPDVIVPIDDTLENLVQHACCHGMTDCSPSTVRNMTSKCAPSLARMPTRSVMWKSMRSASMVKSLRRSLWTFLKNK